MSYHAALSALDPNRATAIEAELASWLSGDYAPVGDNLRRETALPHDVFVRLLDSFAAKLPALDASGPEHFDTVCREYKLKGPYVGGVPPGILGRAVPLDRMVRLLHETYPGFSLSRWELLTRRHAAQPDKLVRQLGQPIPLGRNLIWTTFRNPGRSSSPFGMPPLDTKENIRTALGLGDAPLEQPLVLLVYSPSDPASLDIRVPTVADAGFYRYFRCGQHAETEEHGWTCPLEPNPLGLPGQPEAVHAPHPDYRVTQLTILE